MRYSLAALALKLFSLNSATRKCYRLLGNAVGPRKRMVLGSYYLNRGEWLRRKFVQYVKADRGDEGQEYACTELGTGWMHFYTLYLSLFEDIRPTTFDIWDNRQFASLKANFAQVLEAYSILGDLAPVLFARIQDRVAAITGSADFQELYARTSLRHIIDRNGSLADIPGASQDLVFSMDVLEHVPRRYMDVAIGDQFRILRPGGFAIHQIGIDDHLAHYDSRASRKQYLRYSKGLWEALYENQVQHFNRLSFREFQSVFRTCGFREVESVAQREPSALRDITVHPMFQDQDQESLEATRLFLVYQKPLS